MLSDHVVGTAAIRVSFDRWLAQDAAAVDATRRYVKTAVGPYPAYARNIRDYIAKTNSGTRRDARYVYAVEAMLGSLTARRRSPKP